MTIAWLWALDVYCSEIIFLLASLLQRAKPKAAVVCGEATGWEDRQWNLLLRVHITHTETAREIDLVDSNNINY